MDEGYITDESPLGKVYYLRDGIKISGQICVRYEKHPWITRFEVDGIVPKPLGKRQVRTIQENEMIIGYINSHGRVTRERIEAMCGCGKRHAYTLLHMLIAEGYVSAQGKGRYISYTRGK